MEVAKPTLRSAIFRHDNDYGVDPRSAELRLPALSVSCVVPYYETGSLALACVSRLERALRCYVAASMVPPRTQIVVVDDGSVRYPFPEAAQTQGVRLVRLPKNRGRSVARNAGLAASAAFDLVMFVDSDVLVQDDQVVRTCELWDSGAQQLEVRAAIIANLFTTLRSWSGDLDLDHVLGNANIASDWRWHCRYQPSWLGNAGDWMYVGREFELVHETDFFRRWTGMMGPWALPNMVLGGCFAVPVQLAIKVGGFDESFATYGFTETSLVAKLIAHGVPVIPQVKVAAVHVEANPAHRPQEERNTLFRIAHGRFFREFLAHDLA
jgi:hypothetical protein